MKYVIAGLIFLLVPITGVAQARQPQSKFERKLVHIRKDHDKKFGHKAGGRDIIHQGARHGGRPSMKVKVRYRNTMLRNLHPPVVVVAPAPVSQAPMTNTTPSAPVPQAGYTPLPSSGGNSGGYCGLFQFDQGTWESVGGSGSPCAASSQEQWDRAEQLHQERGNQPWPRCGRNGASLSQIAQCESSGNPQAHG